MSNANDVDSYMRSLAAGAYPNAEPTDESRRRLRRKWIVRVGTGLPSQSEVESRAQQLEARARERMIENYAAHASEAALKESFAGVKMIRADESHLAVEIEFPAPGVAVGDAALVATWEVLRGVDETWDVEELEGVPKRFWFGFAENGGP